MANTSSSSRQRTQVACNRCRDRKIKCSGDRGNGKPCENCARADMHAGQCKFERVGTMPAMMHTSQDIQARDTNRSNHQWFGNVRIPEDTYFDSIPSGQVNTQQPFAPRPVGFSTYPQHQPPEANTGFPVTDPYVSFQGINGGFLHPHQSIVTSYPFNDGMETDMSYGYNPGPEPSMSSFMNPWYPPSTCPSSPEQTLHSHVPHYPDFPRAGSDLRGGEITRSVCRQLKPASSSKPASDTRDNRSNHRMQQTQSNCSTTQRPMHGTPHSKTRVVSQQGGTMSPIFHSPVSEQRVQQHKKRGAAKKSSRS